MWFGVLQIGRGQTELDEERTDGIETDGSVNGLDGDRREKKGKDEGSDDHNSSKLVYVTSKLRAAAL